MNGTHLAAGALAALLLAGAPAATSAQAQPKGRAAAAQPAPAPAAKIAPTEPAPPPPAEPPPWSAAIELGREADSDTNLSGLRLQLSLERQLLPLGASGRLSFVAAAGWFHGEDSSSLFGLVNIDSTVETLEVVPSFRASYFAHPRVRLYADAGVGLARAWATVETSTPLAPGVFTTTKQAAWAGVVRVAAGIAVVVVPQFELGFEVPLSRRYGESTAQTLTFAGTAAYAF
jgi:hypothetical protein